MRDPSDTLRTLPNRPRIILRTSSEPPRNHSARNPPNGLCTPSQRLHHTPEKPPCEISRNCPNGPRNKSPNRSPRTPATTHKKPPDSSRERLGRHSAAPQNQHSSIPRTTTPRCPNHTPEDSGDTDPGSLPTTPLEHDHHGEPPLKDHAGTLQRVTHNQLCRAVSEPLRTSPNHHSPRPEKLLSALLSAPPQIPQAHLCGPPKRRSNGPPRDPKIPSTNGSETRQRRPARCRRRSPVRSSILHSETKIRPKSTIVSRKRIKRLIEASHASHWSVSRT